MILMRFLSRVHFNAPMNPLELEIYRHMQINLKISPSLYEFILMIDADTEVLPDGMNRMISAMIRDSKIIGLCGETLIGNEEDTWVTMIQVYEYFISHHMAKAFESMFGSVTCLPGCFCMYRIRTPTKNIPIIIAPSVIKEYEENLVDTLHRKVRYFVDFNVELVTFRRRSILNDHHDEKLSEYDIMLFRRCEM
jgi:chitin synthase